MRNIWPLGRHRTWREEIDAFVDGELAGERARRFEAHLAKCERCSSDFAGARDVKRLTMALPEVRAPRSFQLTPGMLVDDRAVVRRGGLPVLARLAQVTAGLATLAFAAVLVADLASRGSDGGTTMEAAGGDDAAGGAAFQSTTSDDLRGSAPTSGSPEGTPPTQEIPAVGPSVGAAANPESTPPAPATGRNSESQDQTPQPTDKSPSDSLVPAAGAPATEALGDAVALSAGEDDGGSFNALVAAEIALAALAVVAACTWALTRARR